MSDKLAQALEDFVLISNVDVPTSTSTNSKTLSQNDIDFDSFLGTSNYPLEVNETQWQRYASRDGQSRTRLGPYGYQRHHSERFRATRNGESTLPPPRSHTSGASGIPGSPNLIDIPSRPSHPAASEQYRDRKGHHGGCDHPAPSNPSVGYLNNSTAPHSNILLFLHKALSSAYPKAGIIAVDDGRLNPLAFAADPKNEATATPSSKELPGSPFFEYRYIPPERRSTGTGTENRGSVGISGISLARFDYNALGEKFIIYILVVGYSTIQFFVHEPRGSSGSIEKSKLIIKELLVQIGYWSRELHDEIWVYDGFWFKDSAMWEEMQKANWDDVILPSSLKNSIRTVIASFFKNKATYDEIGIAWKRGLIFYGPPGNGKTISIKAIMKELFTTFGIPTLYVKSVSWAGEIREIFEMARSVAPCMLVLEDLDSFINNANRSYFLNQMDGLEDNNGILVLGTTNHPERLDPGIVARPSRFDRKYEFPLPGPGEGGRLTYIQYWRRKLENRPGIDFPESLVAKIVDMTEGFSFAYIKEAFVATLLVIAAGNAEDGGDDNDGSDKEVFEKVILEQLRNLRKELEDGSGN